MEAARLFLSSLFNRRVNVRLLAVLLAGMAAAAAAVYAVHRVQTRRFAGHFLRQAREARAAGQTAEAAGQYERYLRLVPGDPEALAEFGLLLAETAPDRRAYETVSRALIRQPERADLRRKAAELAIHIGRFADARAQLEDHLLVGSPHDPALLEMLAACHLAADEFEQAAAALRSAVESAPDRPGPYRQLAAVLRGRLDRPDEADRWMRRMVEQNPGSARARRLRADYLLGLGRVEEARAEAEVALKLSPDDQDALWTAARCALAGSRTDDARAHARRAVARDPAQARMYRVLADAELKDGKPAEAVRRLEEGIERAPGDRELLWGLALLAIEAGQADKAQAALDKLRAAQYFAPLLEYAAARVLVLRGDWKGASRRFDSARSGLGPWPEAARDAELWLARCYQRLGAGDLRLAALQRAASLDRSSAAVRAELAAALGAAGRFDEALAVHERLVQLPGAPAQAWIDLARMRLLDNLRREPSKRRWDAVREALDRAAALAPQLPHVAVLRAEVLAAEGRRGEAEKTLRDALRRWPKEPACWAALAALAEAGQDEDGVEKVLDEAARALGDGVPLRLLRARTTARKGGARAAAELQALLDGADKFTPEARLLLQRGVLAGLLRLGDFAAAHRLSRALASADKTDLGVRLLLFELAQRLKDALGMTEALAEIHAIEGDGPHWHYGQAVRFWLAAADGDRGAAARALEHLGQAGRLRPGWGRVPLLAARVHDLQGDRDKALAEYLRAIELGEDSPSALRRAVQLLYADRRFQEADRLIRRVEERQPSGTGEMDRLASDLSLRMEDFDRALETARRAAQNSRDWRDPLWLGQVAAILSQRAKAAGRAEEAAALAPEAEQALRKAAELGSAAPEPWIALVHYLARAGRREEADAVIAQAKAEIAPDQAPLALAQACELAGRLPEAAARYRAALDAAPDDPPLRRRAAEFYLRAGRRLEARAVLEKMAGAPGADASPDAAWARRQLAVLLAARPGEDGFRQALDLVERNLASPAASHDDRRAKAVVLLADPQKRSLSDAVAALAAVVDDPEAATTEDRLLLARLHLENNNWPKAREVLRRLAVSQGRDAGMAAAYAEALLEHGEWTEAQTWVDRVRQLVPGEFAPAALRAKTALARGRVEEALAAVRAYVEDASALPPAREARLLVAAGWLEEESRRPGPAALGAEAGPPGKRLLDEAEAMLRRYAESAPGDPGPLVGFLARAGRSGDALAAAEAAPEGHPRTPALLMLLADLATLQGRFGQTEALYREVIENEPEHVVALNNLAVLLALQGKQPEEALRLIDRAIELSGPEGTLLDSRATVYLALRQPHKALGDLERAIADAPRPTRFFHRALAYGQLSDAREAKAALAEAERLGLTTADLHPLERDAYRRLSPKPE